jgi:hypothetical protein
MGDKNMSRYLVLFRANASVWPVDPKQSLAVLEAVFAGGDQLLRTGATEISWFTAQEGYAIFEADSKDTVLGMIQPFFPYYSQDVHEIVPWDQAKNAMLERARQAATR